MLHINELTYRLGPRVLFDKATAALPERARIGFVGRNGAGKTTLFNMIAGDLTPDSGTISVPQQMRLGRVEQEAPGGPTSLLDFVLSADIERAALLAEAETATDPHRIADIQTRLVDIDAHAAPSRAAHILAGLGFDHEAQGRPLSEFSGGWRMRVALAAVLFSAPDLLLLDEPTNYLDLEGTLWLIDYLARYPATILVISHDRDLLDAVADHILHLDQAKLTLWRGNYASFERQRREQQAILLEAEEEAGRAAQASAGLRRPLPRQGDQGGTGAVAAQDARQDGAGRGHRRRRRSALPPALAAKAAAPADRRAWRMPVVGYGETPVLQKLSLTIAEDDRIGLLGANGNGKSTFAKLVAGRLEADGRHVSSARRNSMSASSPSIRSTTSTKRRRPINASPN